ncbi:MAG: hypothetical protein QHJ73_12945, partial [Armatimonadota bacterium]|nr:hypothetical protein [Armatimonadota bacterium]
LTIDNLIEPRFSTPSGATYETVTGTPALAVAGEKLTPRTINVGVAFQLPAGLTLAADLLDLTGAVAANGKAQFRAGGEFRPNVPFLNRFAVRGGYNQKTGWTGGLSLGGFSLSYAGSIPVIAGQSFNF